jgi:hypothetical protein
MFRHPKYYKELRKLRNKLDQAISDSTATAKDSVRPGPGPKHQATIPQSLKLQAASIKPQAQRLKLKATSNKLLDPGSLKKFQAPLIKALYQDKCIVRMLYMKANLVW